MLGLLLAQPRKLSDKDNYTRATQIASDRQLDKALAPRRIVIFRALQLGDVLRAAPGLRALRNAAPHAHIALIGLPWAQAFVERYADLIDELIARQRRHRE